MQKRIVLAADGMNLDQCLDLVSRVGKQLFAVKVHDLYDEYGSELIKKLKDAGVTNVWVDAKLKDIPKTVELRAGKLMDAGADIITVHTAGEVDMMMAAQNGVMKGRGSRAGMTSIYAVTVLTSMTEEQVHLVYGRPSKAVALHLARLAKLAGINTIVCSAKEVGFLSTRPELKNMQFAVPGIRSAGKEVHDQQRVDTPSAAIKAGATILVMGRQITEAEDPVAEIARIEEEISIALTQMKGATS